MFYNSTGEKPRGKRNGLFSGKMQQYRLSRKRKNQLFRLLDNIPNVHDEIQD
jgi:hypothetical protein